MPINITLGNTNIQMTISSFDSLIAGSGDADITVTDALVGATVDLGTGTDTLTLGNLANTVTVANVDTLTGGTAIDTITLTSDASGMTIDLLGGRSVRLLRGERASAHVVHEDAALHLRLLEESGARWVHIVDLDNKDRRNDKTPRQGYRHAFF